MNKHETYVDLKTAKLLKKLGFDWECSEYYKGNNSSFVWGYCYNWNSPYTPNTEYFSSPTLAVAQKWLREKKNINIYLQSYITPEYDRVNWLATATNIEPVGFEEEVIDIHPNCGYGSYEDELENCIVECLNWLIEQDYATHENERKGEII